MNRTLVLAFFVAAAALTTGCASVTGSPTQSMAVQTRDQTGDEVKGAKCTLINNKGRWSLETPGTTTIQKSNQDMQVNCTKDGLESGNQAVVSETLGSMYGNILIGGGIGALIDHNSGAAYQYPTMVRVLMRAPGKKESESQANTTAQPAAAVRAATNPSAIRTLGPLAVNSGKKPEIGDEWEYLSEDKIYGKRKKLLWRTKSVETDGVVEELVVDGIPSQPWLYKNQPEVIAVSTETGFVFSPHWDTQSSIPEMKVKGAGECSQRLQCVVQVKHAGAERISTNAGTFDAIRIDGTLVFNANPIVQVRGQITAWYSEKDRRLIKQTVTMRTSAASIDEVLELQSARSLQ